MMARRVCYVYVYLRLRGCRAVGALLAHFPNVNGFEEGPH